MIKASFLCCLQGLRMLYVFFFKKIKHGISSKNGPKSESKFIYLNLQKDLRDTFDQSDYINGKCNRQLPHKMQVVLIINNYISTNDLLQFFTSQFLAV